MKINERLAKSDVTSEDCANVFVASLGPICTRHLKFFSTGRNSISRFHFILPKTVMLSMTLLEAFQSVMTRRSRPVAFLLARCS